MIVTVLYVLAWVLPLWHWLTAVIVGFGIPEAIGCLRHDDAYPPLTHVIVRYVHREIAFPAMFGLAGAVGAFWFGADEPWRVGAFAALLGWLNVHFMVRYVGGCDAVP